MTQEFHISVTPLGNDEYFVRTEKVELGVPIAEEQLTWHVEEWLTQARQLMSDPLLGLLQGDRPYAAAGSDLSQNGQTTSAAQTSLSLVNLGQHLYSALFQGTLRDSWVTAQGIAQNRREALRLRLGLKGSRLPRLPWEVMYGNDIPAEKLQQSFSMAARPLAAGTHVIFSRYQPSQRLTSDRLPLAFDSDQPLRILMVIAAPDDQERLQLQQEAKQLQQELAQSPTSDGAATPDIHLTVLDQPGREQLTQALEQGQYQVLHYAGHSDLSSSGGSLYLVNHRTGLTEILSGDDLAGLLVNNGIRLAVFNSCRGAYTATADPVNERERNLAEALVSRGIPAVLAMAEQIPDNVALTLTWLFYRNLKQGYPIDLSLSRARQGLISGYGSHQLYWALPILYLHPEFDGYLTPNDSTFDNPADRLVFMPQGFGSFPVLTINENAPLPTSFLIDDSLPPTDEEMVASAVLSEDDPGDWIEDLDAFDDTDDEAETLDWIRQLTSQASDEAMTNPEAAIGSETASEISPEISPENSSGTGEAIADQVDTLVPSTSFRVTNGFESVFEAPVKPATPPQERVTPAQQTDPSRDITLAKPIAIKPVAAASSASMVQTLPIDGQVAPVQRPRSERRSRTTVHVTDQSSERQGLLVPVLGSLGAVAIAAFSYLIFHPVQGNYLPQGTSQATMPGQVAESFGQKLANSSTAQVQAIAISSFGKQQLAQGQQAIAVLLDRNALPEATAALAAVPQQNQNEPEIQFLRGRLAWQAIKQGNSQYKLADVRQAWENAAQKEPNTALYQQGLGFVYYAEGNPSQAFESWMRARSILENSPSAADSTSAAQPVADLNTAYAGVALSIRQLSTQETPDRQNRISDKADKLYRMVLNSDPAHFSSEALQKNWLWNETTIQDWQKLTQAQ
ncbi:MAG TPA: CHAT domain-containing protein, partial [Coleofasciculaceae cyanobacterium]